MKISVTLDTLAGAGKAVKQYRKQLEMRLFELTKRLTEQGAEIAVRQIADLGAFDSGALSGSIQTVIYVEGNRGVVFTDCPYAAFVEFGTGVVGKGKPHPTLPWQYDVNEHGEAGWVYYDERKKCFRRTKGMPSRPFMYNTVRELAAEAARIAREVLHD